MKYERLPDDTHLVTSDVSGERFQKGVIKFPGIIKLPTKEKRAAGPVRYALRGAN